MNKLARTSVFTTSLLLAGFFFATSAFAINSNGASRSAMARLKDTNLKSCQARESAIDTRSSHLTELAVNMEEKFDSIAKRVEDYYNSKVVPSGKTVSSYSNLVSDIQTKKNDVSAALTKAQTDAKSFSCTSDNPKEQMTQFRIDMQAVKAALKSYRTSIKNLIVAVHSVSGETDISPTASPSGENK